MKYSCIFILSLLILQSITIDENSYDCNKMAEILSKKAGDAQLNDL